MLKEERQSLEKRYNVFAPYKENDILKNYWNNIFEKCLFLKDLNIKNKILINKKFYLNQYFLELFSSDKKYITYNFDGNLKKL